MTESTIRDATGAPRPVRHLDPDRVRRSPGAQRVEDTWYVADRLIVRGAPPAEVRQALADNADVLAGGGQEAVVLLGEWTADDGEPTTWLQGVRQIASTLGYRVAYDGSLGELPDDEEQEFGWALRLVPLRDDDVEVDAWQVLELITAELGGLDSPDPGDEGIRPTPRAGLEHVLRSLDGGLAAQGTSRSTPLPFLPQGTSRSTPLPFVPVGTSRSTPLPVGAIEQYGAPGTGGQMPARYLGAPPRRALADGETPWVAADGTRRPVVALVDTGVGSHPWFGPYVPHDPRDGAVVVRTATVDGQPVGTFPVPVLDTEDAEFGGLSVNPLTGPLDPVAGHGTFMAGIVHQVCPDALLMSVRAFGGSGYIPEWEVLRTLWRLLRFHRRGVEGVEGYHRVDVVVLAMGYYHEQPKDHGYDRPLRTVLRALRRAGVVVVVASGNDGTTRPMFPAAWAPHVDRTNGQPVPIDDAQLSADHPPLVSVGATNPDGTTAVFSNDGPWVTCVRPGAAMLSTMPDTLDGPQTPLVRLRERLYQATRASIDPDDFTGGYATWSGTSFSAPYLAAEVAQAILDAEVSGQAVGGVEDAWHAVTQVTGLSKEGPGR